MQIIYQNHLAAGTSLQTPTRDSVAHIPQTPSVLRDTVSWHKGREHFAARRGDRKAITPTLKHYLRSVHKSERIALVP